MTLPPNLNTITAPLLTTIVSQQQTNKTTAGVGITYRNQRGQSIFRHLLQQQITNQHTSKRPAGSITHGGGDDGGGGGERL